MLNLLQIGLLIGHTHAYHRGAGRCRGFGNHDISQRVHLAMKWAIAATLMRESSMACS